MSNFISFFLLFSINDLLHRISEKVVIVIFLFFIVFLILSFHHLIEIDFRSSISNILYGIRGYVNHLFDFLYLQKLSFIWFYILNTTIKRITFNIIPKFLMVFIISTTTYGFKVFNLSQKEICL